MKNPIAAIAAAAVLLGAVFLLFYRLAEPPIRIWDEAIYANNALEMYIGGDWLVLKNDGAANLYNSKPPLVIWMQCLGFSLFGINEWAVRFPSALSAFVTVAAVLLFAFRVLKKPLVGIFAALTLLASQGFMLDHAARTGDLDAVLTMFVTLSALWFFTFLLRPDAEPRSFIIGTTALTVLAFFTKSSAGLIPLPGLFFCLLWSSKRKAVLQDKTLYISVAAAIAVALFYYLLREYLAPGYLQKVFDSEYKRIAVNIMPWHAQPFFFYTENWVKDRTFYPFVWAVPLAVPLLFWRKNPLVRQFVGYALVWSLSFFLILSAPAVKLSWYSVPMLPMLSLLVGCVGSWAVMDWFWDFRPALRYAAQLAVGLALASVFATGIRKNIAWINANSGPRFEAEKTGGYLRELRLKMPGVRRFTVLEQEPAGKPEHLDATKFYVKSFPLKYGYQVRLSPFLKDVRAGDTVVTCQGAKFDSLRQYFQVRTIHAKEVCKTVVLEGLR